MNQADAKGRFGVRLSMRSFQNLIDSGNPARSCGSGKSFKKESASSGPKERSPRGTTGARGRDADGL